jgi:Tol biopolymer transport system component
MKRRVAILALLALMGGFAFGVNRFLESRRTNIPTDTTVAKPTAARAQLVLPGTMFVAQHGDIYRLSGGYFADLHLPTNGTWMQPAVIPGSSNIVAVLRSDAYSDIYMLGGDGGNRKQLSNNATKSSIIQFNHWMFWPRVAGDGQTLLVSYDAPKDSNSYEIEFAVWQGSLAGKVASKQITDPFAYTGGDVSPVPMADGTVLYSKYEIGDGQVFSRLAIQTKALATPTYLTDATDDCGQPALAPNGLSVAMVCTGGTGLQSTRLEVAPLLGTKLGTRRVLVDNCLCAAPSWAPDGTGLVYYAPADASGHFQLWWILGAATFTAHAPQQVTTNLDFDATSPPAWSPLTNVPYQPR